MTPEEEYEVAKILESASSTVILEKFAGMPELTPAMKYALAKRRLEKPYGWKVLWESANYNASNLHALEDFVETCKAAKRVLINNQTGIFDFSVAADDGYIQATIFKQFPYSAEELAEAQAIVDAGPPPEQETIKWLKPASFQLKGEEK